MRGQLFFNETIPKGARAYILSVILVGLSLLLYGIYYCLIHFDSRWAYLGGLTVLASCLPVTIRFLKEKPQSITITVGDVFVFAGLLLFGPQVGVVLAAIEGIISSLRVKVSHWYKFLFNLAHLAAVAFFVGHLFYLLEGGFSASQPMNFPRLLGEVTLCALLYFMLNSVLIAVAMKLVTGQPWQQLWRKNFICAIPANLVNGLAAAVVFLWTGSDIFTTDVAISIVFLSYYGLALWLQRQSGREQSSSA